MIRKERTRKEISFRLKSYIFFLIRTSSLLLLSRVVPWVVSLSFLLLLSALLRPIDHTAVSLFYFYFSFFQLLRSHHSTLDLLSTPPFSLAHEVAFSPGPIQLTVGWVCRRHNNIARGIIDFVKTPYPFPFWVSRGLGSIHSHGSRIQSSMRSI